MTCPVCSHTQFTELYRQDKLPVFAALRAKPFSEKARFDAVLYRCSSCGFVTQKLSPSLKRFLEAFYTEETSFFSGPPGKNVLSARTKNNLVFLKTHVKGKVRSLLEIGAYDGYFTDLIRKQFAASESIGIEIMRSKSKFPKITLVHESYPSKTVASKKFDLIVIMNVLEHVFTPKKFMEAIQNNLSDTGQVLIEVPNEENAFRSGMLSFQHQHISYFTPATMQRFLLEIGFKIDALYTKDLDRMMLIVSKTAPQKAKSAKAEPSSLLYKKTSKALIKKFTTLIASNEMLGVYGACTFTHNILQTTGMTDSVAVFDGDPHKEGKYMSDVSKPVKSWKGIDASGLDSVLIMPESFTKEIYTFFKTKKIRTPVKKLFS